MPQSSWSSVEDDEEINSSMYSRENAVPPSALHLPTSSLECAEEYIEFFWKTKDLLSELPRLKFALGRVGGCGPAIQAIDAFNRPFQDLQWLLGLNTYSLSPQPSDPRFTRLRPRSDEFLSKFPCTLDAVADGLELMEKTLGNLHGAYHENTTMYLLMCLRKRFRYEARRITIARGSYATTSTEELKHKMQQLLGAFLIRAVESLRKELGIYCEKGIQDISSLQESKSKRYLNLTTIATFLSGVTASFLQISVDDTNSFLAIGVNTCLFSSLTFSIASATNSLLVVTWLASAARNPSVYMPRWISACINKGPMILLVVSLVLFAAALCLLVFSSSQHIATSILTVSFAGLYTVCFFLLTMWLILDKGKFQDVHKTRSIANSTVGPGANFLYADGPSELERGKYAEDVSWPPNVEDHDDRPTDIESEVRRIPMPPVLGPDALGHAPNVPGGHVDQEGSEYDSAGLQHRHRRPSIPSVGDDVYDQHETPKPIGNHSPPPPPIVQLHTYAVPLVLPRDDQGEPVEVDTPSSDGVGVPAFALPWSNPPQPPYSSVCVPPPVRKPRRSASSYKPSETARSSPSQKVPKATSTAVSVITTNASSTGIPPGSYVAYTTQPASGPSAQAGNYTIYHLSPINRVPSASIIPEPPQEPSAMLRFRSGDRGVVYVPEHGDGHDDLRATTCNVQHSEEGANQRQDTTSSNDSYLRERTRTQPSTLDILNSVHGISVTAEEPLYAPTTTSQSVHNYPSPSSLPHKPIRRIYSTNSRVRFERSAAAQSVATGEQNITPLLSQPLTDSPKKVEEPGVGEPETQSSMRPPAGSRTSTVVEELGLQNGGGLQASPTQQNKIDRVAPSAHDSANGRREHSSEDLSTMEKQIGLPP